MENHHWQMLRFFHLLGSGPPMDGRRCPFGPGITLLVKKGYLVSESQGNPGYHQSLLRITQEGVQVLRDTDRATFGHEPEDPVFQDYINGYKEKSR